LSSNCWWALVTTWCCVWALQQACICRSSSIASAGVSRLNTARPLWVVHIVLLSNEVLVIEGGRWKIGR
jgi:hypothetical protein